MNAERVNASTAKCPICGDYMLVTKKGLVRKHGRKATGHDGLSCAGSGAVVVDAPIAPSIHSEHHPKHRCGAIPSQTLTPPLLSRARSRAL